MFVSISKALQSNPSIRDKKKREDLPEAVTLFIPEGTSGSDEAEAASGKKIPRPSGSKGSKRRVEEEKIMDNVASKLKEGLPVVSTGAVVAKVITDFSSVLSSLFNQWQEQNQYQNVDPVLQKTYKELLIKKKITELEHSLRNHDTHHQVIQEEQIEQQQQIMEEQMTVNSLIF
jgi:hypothetical protein